MSVIHGTVLAADQLQLLASVANCTVPVPPLAAKDWLAGVRAKLQLCPPSVTLKLVTVIVIG